MIQKNNENTGWGRNCFFSGIKSIPAGGDQEPVFVLQGASACLLAIIKQTASVPCFFPPYQNVLNSGNKGGQKNQN